MKKKSQDMLHGPLLKNIILYTIPVILTGALQQFTRDEAAAIIESYGGKSLHEMSHGESFFTLMLHRFGGNGLYILDEPEAALSPSRTMSMLTLMHDLCKKGAQFIISTHSPILLAYPGAVIYELSEDGIRQVSYRETGIYQVMKQFLDSPERMVRYLTE